MIGYREPPAGCLVYFMLSIVINLFIAILRISAQDVQNNSTLPTSVHRFDANALMNIKTSDVKTSEIATTSAMDAYNQNGTELDSHKSITTYQHQMSVNLTGVESAAPSTFVATPLSKQHDTNTELMGNDDGTAVDFVNEALATVIPVSTVVSAMPSDAVIALATGAANLQTPNPLQRSRNNTKATVVSRNQLSSRTSIKSSSPFASANNNTAPQKFHKTDAPTMLNYIFDSHLTNKHRHYDPRYGPHFDDVHVAEKVGNVSAQVGNIAYLNCRIRLLQDKTVTWLKREQNNDYDIQLLTIGVQTYTFDKRFSVEFEYPNNWRLRIADINKTDGGLYECQISTHPPRAIRTRLHVKAPEVLIVDEFEQPLVDKYYEVDSTIELVCTVRHVSMLSSTVSWLHGNQMLNYDMTRGGIRRKSCRIVSWKCCVITLCGRIAILAWSLYSHSNIYFKWPLSSLDTGITFALLIDEFYRI
ncbi:uncharacterized protein LOC129566198 isoform X2 [Sitodiplosis mosellana]|uniref:uncharacterized protein LOC129566198 isoform X2 n=1 Tax=Sitodiplosis mosellana TaxID=263140 RepID=UPI00244471B2|nr:uncharacterized protein LOC129566198 isoform X2 [Sitodiplosis mosellana]